MKKNILYEISRVCGFISVVGYIYPLLLAYLYLKTNSAMTINILFILKRICNYI